MTFTLRPEARWHDGEPITVEDVIWSFETLTRPRAHQDSTASITAASTSAEKVG